MLKKVFCLIVVFAMIVPLAACKSKTSVNGPEETQQYIDVYYDENGNPINQEGGNAGQNTIPPVDVPPPGSFTDVTKAFDASGNIDKGYIVDTTHYTSEVTFNIGWNEAQPNINNDDIGRYIQNKFKCKFDIKSLDDTKIPLLAANDGLPDLFSLDLSAIIFTQLEKCNYLYHIPRNTLDKYPLLKKYFNNHAYLNAFSDTSPDNQYVGLPFSGSAIHPSKGYQVSLFYRTDWQANVGMGTPQSNPIDTVDKSYQLMKAFRENDPDKNGAKDTYGFTGGLWNIHYIPWVDTYSWVKESSGEFAGKWIPGCWSSELHDGLIWWNKLLKEDIVPADFTLQKAIDSFASDQTGVAYANTDPYWTWQNLTNVFDPAHQGLYKLLPKKADGSLQTVDDVVGEFPPLKLTDNSEPRFPAQIESSIKAISAKAGKDPEKISRLLDFYEWTITQEGTDLIAYGFKGRDYVIDNQGMVVQTLPTSDTQQGAKKKIWEVYPSVQIGNFVAYNLNTPTPSRQGIYPKWVTDRYNRVQAVKDQYTVIPTIAINNIVTNTKQNHLNDSFSILWWEDQLNRIVVSNDVEGAWNNYLNDVLNNKEGRKIIDEVNAEIVARGIG